MRGTGAIREVSQGRIFGWAYQTAPPVLLCPKPEEIYLEKNKEVISDKILTNSYAPAAQTLAEILNDIKTTSSPPEI